MFGGPVAPSIAFGGYDGKNYTDASTLVVTFVINNHDDDSKNGRAKAWEKKFIDYMKNFKDEHLEVAFMAERSIEDELERESHAGVYTILVSYLIMFLYITIALGQINQCDRFMVSVQSRYSTVIVLFSKRSFVRQESLALLKDKKRTHPHEKLVFS